MSNHTGRLILSPQDPNSAPEPGELIRTLRSAGFLGGTLETDADRFLVGEEFLQLVTFAGCAVQVDVSPRGTDDKPFCHIRIAGPYTTPRAMLGSNTRPPRCPTCRTPLRNWRTVLGPSLAAATASLCPACATSAPLCAWDWKESGGFARLAIWIEEVFPGEAAPTDALMQLLSSTCGDPWRHFYLQE